MSTAVSMTPRPARRTRSRAIRVSTPFLCSHGSELPAFAELGQQFGWVKTERFAGAGHGTADTALVRRWTFGYVPQPELNPRGHRYRFEVATLRGG